MADQPECKNCDSLGWVCENHPDRPWKDGGSERADACDCGAGSPCLICNPCGDESEPPRDLAGSRPLWSLKDGWAN